MEPFSLEQSLGIMENDYVFVLVPPTTYIKVSFHIVRTQLLNFFFYVIIVFLRNDNSSEYDLCGLK